MSKYSKWDKDVEGAGCTPNCFDFHGLIMDTKALYQWKSEQKERLYPYVCASDCAVGYTWQKNAKRCVNIVNKYVGEKKQSEASVQCAKDNGRLLSINSCEEFEGLAIDLWNQNPTDKQSYWVGFYMDGFDFYHHQKRTSSVQADSINSLGQIGLMAGGAKNCNNNGKIRMTNSNDQASSSFPKSANGYYGELVYKATKEIRMKVQEFITTDSLDRKTYLCEKDHDWTCPAGYILFQEICYKFFETEVTAAAADIFCLKEGGKVTEASTRLHQNFLTAWLQNEDYNFTQVWLGYRRHVNTFEAAEDDDYRSLDNLPSPFTTSVNASTTDNCLVLGGDPVATKTVSCQTNSPYVCQVNQVLSEELKFSIPLPQILMPLDLSSGFNDYHTIGREINDSQVAITHQPSPLNGLSASAHFMGRQDSYIRIKTTSPENSIRYKFGLTITIWIYIDKIDSLKRQYLIDGSGPCITGEETHNNFQMFLEKGYAKGSELNYDTSAPCGNVPDSSIAGGSGQEYIKLVVVLCDGPTIATDTVQAGSCKTFESSKKMPLEENKWIYIGLTYDPFNKKGTILINDLFGYQETASVSKENEYFTYDTKQWLGEYVQALEGPIRLGAKKYESPSPTEANSFTGKMSCLQLYESFMRPSQVQHLKKCPLDGSYIAHEKCPSDYTYFKGHCYKISGKAETFSTAEYQCSRLPGNLRRQTIRILIYVLILGQNYNSRLAFPPDYRSLDFVSQLGFASKYEELWVGLDGRSGWTQPEEMNETVWVTSSGDNLTEINWNGSKPVDDLDKQCVYLDYNSGG